MKIVLLAAGHGRRFGGLKQLAPVGPRGEAILDYTVAQAARAGYSGIVLVVREEIKAEMLAHAAHRWPAGLPVEAVVQGPAAGTVPALLAAGPVLDEAFAVANADDLYGEPALQAVAQHLSSKASPSALVGYRLRNTVLSEQPVKRGLCVVSRSGLLQDLLEHHVCAQADGTFEAVPLREAESGAEVRHARLLGGDELVSMNLWGFTPSVLPALEAVAQPGGPEASVQPLGELLLPEVLGQLVRSGRQQVQVIPTTSRCVGLTHREDLALVRASLGFDGDGEDPTSSGTGQSATAKGGQGRRHVPGQPATELVLAAREPAMSSARLGVPQALSKSLS